MNPDTFLKPEERDRIRDAVGAAESRSAGEIRILIAGRSAPRATVLAVLDGLLTGSVIFWVLSRMSWGHPGIADYLMAAAAGLLSALPIYFLVPVPPAVRARAVRRRAEREFESLGIGKTEGSTGVLVFLSLKEHEAVVLADRGINEKVPPDTWNREVATIIDGIKRGAAGEGIVKAVADIGELLALHFPRRPDDRNELPDDVVTRK